MPLVLILAIACGQSTDIGFRHAVESSIHRFGTVTHYDAVMPLAHAELIRDLSCPRYAHRQRASASLEALGPRGFRALTWGSWSADREVADRCGLILAKIHRCSHCNGSGVCPIRDPDTWHQCEKCGTGWMFGPAARSCRPCDGFGDLMPHKRPIEE